MFFWRIIKLLFLKSIFLILILSTSIYSQAERFTEVILDSTLTFEALTKEYEKTAFSNPKKLEIAFNYLKKAKEVKDSSKIIEGMFLIGRAYRVDRLKGIEYLDSVINFTIKQPGYVYPAKAYHVKGVHQYFMNKHNMAIENYVLAERYAKAYGNDLQVLKARHSIGILKNNMRLPKEGIALIKKNLAAMPELEYRTQNTEFYINTLFALSDGYNRLQNTDSASHFIKKAINFSIKFGDKYQYHNLLLASGINNFLKKKYQLSIDSITKARPLFALNAKDMNNSICDLYVSKSYLALNKHNEAISYLQAIDARVTPSNYTSDLRDAFVLLLNEYERTGQIKKELDISKKLILYDSLSNTKNFELNTKIFKQYEIKNLLNDKDQLIDQIKTRVNNQKRLVTFIVFVIVALILSIYFYFISRSKIEIKNAANNITSNINFLEKSSEADPGSKVRKTMEITEKITTDILNKLNRFEITKGYLKPHMTLKRLSDELNTNSSYLSKVINKKLDKNFTTYINDLRIVYTIEKLETDGKFRKYSLATIAEETGFSSERSFLRAFQKKIGVTPYNYIKRFESEGFKTDSSV